jgi:hypothetical protein
MHDSSERSGRILVVLLRGLHLLVTSYDLLQGGGLLFARLHGKHGKQFHDRRPDNLVEHGVFDAQDAGHWEAHRSGIASSHSFGSLLIGLEKVLLASLP